MYKAKTYTPPRGTSGGRSVSGGRRDLPTPSPLRDTYIWTSGCRGRKVVSDNKTDISFISVRAGPEGKVEISKNISGLKAETKKKCSSTKRWGSDMKHTIVGLKHYTFDKCRKFLNFLIWVLLNKCIQALSKLLLC